MSVEETLFHASEISKYITLCIQVMNLMSIQRKGYGFRSRSLLLSNRNVFLSKIVWEIHRASLDTKKVDHLGSVNLKTV